MLLQLDMNNTCTKENIIYVKCPDCYGEGRIMIAKMYPSGHTECWENCEFCNGDGDFEEADYLIMRLEGKV